MKHRRNSTGVGEDALRPVLLKKADLAQGGSDKLKTPDLFSKWPLGAGNSLSQQTAFDRFTHDFFAAAAPCRAMCGIPPGTRRGVSIASFSGARAGAAKDHHEARAMCEEFARSFVTINSPSA
jgi:hypothetical protein